MAFQYVGQVRVGGHLFDGTGQFKFAIGVVDGVFNVAVGDRKVDARIYSLSLIQWFSLSRKR